MTDLKRRAANFLGVLNDLKRNDETAARELAVPVEKLRAWTSGAEPTPGEVLDRAAQIWPVNRRDFEILEDDAPNGVRVMRAAESKDTERVLSRGGSPYYAYRDTAMSRTSALRPEWIQELKVVDNNDPENKEVHWNNGHFLHQFTYFVGPVNFYYMENAKRCVAPMNTGDTMYISPFVPHTFTSRRAPDGKLGLILALTFGGRLFGETKEEMSALGLEIMESLNLGAYEGRQGMGALLRRHLDNAMMPLDTLGTRLQLPSERLHAWYDGREVPAPELVAKVAAALGMNVREFLPYDRQQPLVVLGQASDPGAWEHGSYKVKPLAATSLMPEMRPFEVTVNPGATPGPALSSSLFQFGYVLGQKPIELSWESGGRSHSERLSPDDSFLMKPGVRHRFNAPDGQASVLVLRSAGRLAGDASLELATIGGRGIARAVRETMQWYNPAGTKH